MSLLPSWVPGANDPEGEFPLNNLPCGAMEAEGGPRCVVAIGDRVLDVSGEALDCIEPGVLAAGTWNRFMAKGPALWGRLRAELQRRLGGDAPDPALERRLHPLGGASLRMPFDVAEFTDFYASRHHATNVGTMFRGAADALPGNWLSIPIGYNGRASTVVVSGTDVVRPMGQTRPPGAELPVWGPSRRLDLELELGAVVGRPSRMGERWSVAEADAAIFGYVLLNDWSARDVQAWEYRPLGPFQAKAFATTISPWIVTAAALAPFRVDAPPRERPLLDHLHEPGPMLHDIDLSVELAPAGAPATTIARTNARELYYSSAQQLAHHTSSGCAMRVGDLLGSGTISGPDPGTRGSLLEASWGGEEPVPLQGGGTRSFLEDGDTVTLRGRARGEGYDIGFGACAGTIRAARAHIREAS